MELFDTSWWSSIDVLLSKYGSTDIFVKLRTWIGASWWSLRLLQMLYQPTSIAVNGFLNNVVINTASAGNAGSDDAVKGLGIYSWSSWISEVRLFGFGLETEIEAGWWSSCMLQILYWPTSIAVNGFLNNGVISATDIGNAGSVKHSGIHLQSFQILKVKLFETGLETGTKVG